MDALEGGIRELAKRLGLGERAAYRAAERGELPAIRIGGRWVVPRAAFQKFLSGDWKSTNHEP